MSEREHVEQVERALAERYGRPVELSERELDDYLPRYRRGERVWLDTFVRVELAGAATISQRVALDDRLVIVELDAPRTVELRELRVPRRQVSKP